jgi:hypothetical protein
MDAGGFMRKRLCKKSGSRKNEIVRIVVGREPRSALPFTFDEGP